MDFVKFVNTVGVGTVMGAILGLMIYCGVVCVTEYASVDCLTNSLRLATAMGAIAALLLAFSAMFCAWRGLDRAAKAIEGVRMAFVQFFKDAPVAEFLGFIVGAFIQCIFAPDYKPTILLAGTVGAAIFSAATLYFSIRARIHALTAHLDAA